jgi:hypothetical protein
MECKGEDPVRHGRARRKGIVENPYATIFWKRGTFPFSHYLLDSQILSFLQTFSVNWVHLFLEKGRTRENS